MVAREDGTDEAAERMVGGTGGEPDREAGRIVEEGPQNSAPVPPKPAGLRKKRVNLMAEFLPTEQFHVSRRPEIGATINTEAVTRPSETALMFCKPGWLID